MSMQVYIATLVFPDVVKAHTFTAPECSPRTDLEVQQAHYGPRARKDPRIQLHLVLFPRQPPRIFAMQSTDIQVQEGLVRITREMRDNRRVSSCEDETAVQKLDALEHLPILIIV
ncbi:hypothetical protein B0H19DRAFT_1066748 [Mycena capillaripes]|nr:hypothetical protein B0H19DRAFT_1066748 [Mycena capillaripes]